MILLWALWYGKGPRSFVGGAFYPVDSREVQHRGVFMCDTGTFSSCLESWQFQTAPLFFFSVYTQWHFYFWLVTQDSSLNPLLSQGNWYQFSGNRGIAKGFSGDHGKLGKLNISISLSLISFSDSGYQCYDVFLSPFLPVQMVGGTLLLYNT